MVKNIKPPQSFKEVVDVLIGEVALTRRKFESLLEVLDEKGLISQEEFKNKFKEKSKTEKLEILIESLSLNSKEK